MKEFSSVESLGRRVLLRRSRACPLKQRELLLLGDRGVKSCAFHVRRGKLFGSRVSCKPSKSPLHGKCEWHTVVNWAHGFVRLGRHNGESVVLPNPSQKKGASLYGRFVLCGCCLEVFLAAFAGRLAASESIRLLHFSTRRVQGVFAARGFVECHNGNNAASFFKRVAPKG